MKRIILIINLIFITSSTFSQRTDLSGLKFCIDPGHGGYFDATDRHVIPDPGTNFWESESNFQKAISLKSLLEAKGAWVILTRYTNDYPSDNEPSLSARSAVANSNNVNWFHSIHSNAFNGNTNYTLVLLKENISTRQAQFPEAYTMSDIIGKNIKNYIRTGSTHYVRLDYTFYGGTNGGYNLGVLNGALMPSELSEGSFHDYFPETRRLMNNDYRKTEAYALRNSFMQYFGVPFDSLGIVAGIIRDQVTLSPINGVKVRLIPGDSVYIGDNYNNGYYFFDKLKPGDYKLVFESSNYIIDSAFVTIPVSGIVFSDKDLMNFIPPKITSTTPNNADTLVSVYNPITINFSKTMDTASVRKAFTINPNIDGYLTWSNKNMTVKFTSYNIFGSKTNYKLKIDTNAKDNGGFKIDGNGDGISGEPFILNFITGISDLERPTVMSTIPLKTSTTKDFNITSSISITFSKLMDTTSLKEAIQLRKSSINVDAEMYFTNFNGRTIVTLKPKSNMERTSLYLVIVYTTAKDIYSNYMKAIYYFYVNTGDRAYKNITSLESFDSGITNWFQPTGSGSTTGVKTDSTILTEDNLIYFPNSKDKKSAKLSYAWAPNSSSYLLREYLSKGPGYGVQFDSSFVLQSYVFGDSSLTKFRFCVDDSSTLIIHKVNNWITIDWYGWKLIEWKLTNPAELGYWFNAGKIAGPKNRFDSYQLTYDGGKQSGEIYFDELRIAEIDNTPNKVEQIKNELPTGYVLKQNYPNPFNPSTEISYQLPVNSFVTLKIYDLLGREMACLVNEKKQPGTYQVKFDGRNLASGIYYYKLVVSGSNPLQTEKYSEMKKMIFIR